jgi:hypothetical protein
MIGIDLALQKNAKAQLRVDQRGEIGDDRKEVCKELVADTPVPGKASFTRPL